MSYATGWSRLWLYSRFDQYMYIWSVCFYCIIIHIRVYSSARTISMWTNDLRSSFNPSYVDSLCARGGIIQENRVSFLRRENHIQKCLYLGPYVFTNQITSCLANAILLCALIMYMYRFNEEMMCQGRRLGLVEAGRSRRMTLNRRRTMGNTPPYGYKNNQTTTRTLRTTQQCLLERAIDDGIDSC